jgi:mono/diheme cytochrome c family protein
VIAAALAARVVAAVALATATAGGSLSKDLSKSSPEAKVVRGSIVFNTYCVLCHGAHGEGDGRAARIHKPPPADLTKSPYNDAYKELIIRRGGEALGRSGFMPPWGEQLTDEQIRDVVAFLRVIKVSDRSR